MLSAPATHRGGRTGAVHTSRPIRVAKAPTYLSLPYIPPRLAYGSLGKNVAPFSLLQLLEKRLPGLSAKRKRNNRCDQPKRWSSTYIGGRIHRGRRSVIFCVRRPISHNRLSTTTSEGFHIIVNGLKKVRTMYQPHTACCQAGNITARQ